MSDTPTIRPFPEWSEAFQTTQRHSRTMLQQEAWIDPDGYFRLDCLAAYYDDLLARHHALEPSLFPSRTLARAAARKCGYAPEMHTETSGGTSAK